MLVSIDRAGRIVIPQEIRERLALGADAELELTVEGDSLRVSPRRTRGRRIVEVDGWPVIERIDGYTISDSDVQRWRDDVERRFPAWV